MKLQSEIVGTLFGLGLAASFAAPALAQSLECYETDSFTNRTFNINRDGAIGFNGTYVTMTSPIGFWGTGHATVIDLTGRPEDQDYQLKGLELPISPRGACTPADTALDHDFTCQVNGATISAEAEAFLDTVPAPALTEDVKKSIRLKADVTLQFKVTPGPTAGDTGYSLSGTVTEATQGRSIQFLVPIRSSTGCKLIDP